MKAVKASIDLSVGSEIAIRAFLDPVHLRGWWGVERCLIEEQPGGLYQLTWQISEQGFGYVTTGIVEAIGPRKLHIRQMAYFNPEKQILGPMTLRVDAVLNKGGCTLTVIQDGYRSGGDWDWYYEVVTQAWPDALRLLKDYLED